MPSVYCVLSSATYEILSYVAHEKRLPAQISDPKCRPPLDGKIQRQFCTHDYAYLGELEKDNDANPAGLRTSDSTMLAEVGFLKSLMGKARIHREAIYGLTESGRIKLSSGHYGLQPELSRYTSETREVALRDQLNYFGEESSLQVDNTGAYTILKHLNDLEMTVLNNIVERDAPECREQLKRFKRQVNFTYRSIGIVDGAEPRYPKTVTTVSPIDCNRLLQYVDVWCPNPSGGGGHMRSICINPGADRGSESP